MIWESGYWKKPLVKLADKITRWQRQKKWTEQILVNIEREFFLAFYSIRKLMEAKKLTDKTRNLKVLMKYYPNKGKDVHYMNWDNIEKLYDLSIQKSETRNLEFICNQVIHSYVFIINISESGLFDSIFFCSDRIRNSKIYELEVNKIQSIFRTVGRDYPYKATYQFDESKKDYIISQQ